MKIVLFVVAAVLFVGSFLMFGYADQLPDPLNFIVFLGGILVASIALMIPFHLADKFD